MKGCLCNVAHIVSSVRSNYPCLENMGRVYFMLRWQLRAYERTDPHLDCVCVIPIALLNTCYICLRLSGNHQFSVANLLYIIYFFLCHPGEYCKVISDTRLNPSGSATFNFKSDFFPFAAPMHLSLPYVDPHLSPSPSVTQKCGASIIHRLRHLRPWPHVRSKTSLGLSGVNLRHWQPAHPTTLFCQVVTSMVTSHQI